MDLKTLNYIRNKKELQSLFLSQFSADYIRKEINEILRETRVGITAGMRICANNISTAEAIIFIDRNGKPDGYVLSEELKMILSDYRENVTKQKTLQRLCNV